MNEDNKTPEETTLSHESESNLVTPGSESKTDTPVVSSPEPKKKQSKKKLLVTVLLALVLLGGAAAAWMMLKEDKETAVVKKDVAVLKFGVQSDGLDLELPFDAADEDTLQLFRQTHEGLVTWNEQTNIVPAIAKSWTSPNETTWEFVLNSGRSFHTGKPITPEAVKASIEAVMALDSELPTVQTIKSVTAEGTDKVTIVTKAPDATLLNRLASLYIFDTTYEKGQSWNSGSGAYKLKAGTEVTADSLTLAADDSFPEGRPYVREVQVVNLTSNEDAEKALKDGTVDITSVGPTDSETAKNYANYSFSPIKSSGAFSLRLNTLKTGGIFTSKALRQAVATAIDNKKIIAADTDQGGEPANQLVPETIPGYNPNIKAVGPDLVKAKQLLKDAGYTNQVVKVGYYAGRQDKPMLEVIRQLKELGMNVEVGTKDSGKDFIEAIIAGSYDVVATSSLTAINDLSDVAADIGGANSYVPMYFNAEIDTKLDEANKIFDASKRLVKLQEISKFVVDDYGFIPVRYSLYPLYVNNNLVTGKADVPTTSNPYYLYKVYGK